MRHARSPFVVELPGESPGGVFVNIGEAEILDDRVCEVGESPVWDAALDRVVWVDIHGRRILWRQLSSGEVGSVTMLEHVSAALPTESSEWLACLKDGLYAVDLEDEARQRLCLLPHAMMDYAGPPMRTNDAKVTPTGSVLVGTMPYEPDTYPGVAALYEWRDHRLTLVRDGVTVSNGIGWSPDGEWMYYVDSPTRRVEILAWSPEGRPVDHGTLITLEPEWGIPDGLCVDSQGFVWLAMWGGGRVLRIDHEGQISGFVSVPTPQVTSCAFVGSDLSKLAITTAALNQVADFTAGKTFIFEPSVSGLPQPLVKVENMASN